MYEEYRAVPKLEKAIADLDRRKLFACPEEITRTIAAAEQVPGADAIQARVEPDLNDAIASGDPVAIFEAAKWQAVFGESKPSAVAQDRSLRILLGLLLTRYDWQAAHEAVAAEMRRVGARLEAACAAVRPDADPQGLGQEQLEPWQQIPGLAAELDQLLEIAAICSGAVTGSSIKLSDPRQTFYLVSDEPGAVQHWIAPQTRRGGRWAALMRAGFSLNPRLV